MAVRREAPKSSVVVSHVNPKRDIAHKGLFTLGINMAGVLGYRAVPVRKLSLRLGTRSRFIQHLGPVFLSNPKRSCTQS